MQRWNFLAGLMLAAPMLAQPAPAQSGEPTTSHPRTQFFSNMNSAADLRFFSTTKAHARNRTTIDRLGYQTWSLSFAALDQRLADQTVQTQLSLGLKSSQIHWKTANRRRSSTPIDLPTTALSLHAYNWIQPQQNPSHCNRSPSDISDQHQHNLSIKATRRLCLDLPVSLYVQGELEIDTKARCFSQYSLGSLSFFGVKKLDQTQLTLGVYRELGRRSHLFFPLAGLKTELFQNCTLDILLPLHAKIQCQLKPQLDLFAAIRTLRDRQRSQPQENILGQQTSKGIWEYKAYTATLGLNYRYQLTQLGLEVGQTLNSHTRVYNAHGDHESKHSFKNSTFMQLQLQYIF